MDAIPSTHQPSDRRRGARRLRPLIAVLALGAVAVVPAVASATFAPAVDLSAPGSDAQYGQIAVGPDGATTVVWSRYDGRWNTVQQATRPAGSSTFSAPVSLSDPGSDSLDPHVAVGPDGQTTVVWRHVDAAQNDTIQVATRPSGSTSFSAPLNVDYRANGNGGFSSPHVAVGPTGQTILTWLRGTGAVYIVSEASRAAGSSTFSAPEDLSNPTEDTEGGQTAFGPDGQATVTWYRNDGASTVVQTRTRPAGSSTFDAAVDLSAPGGTALDPVIAVGPDGRTTVVWREAVGGHSIASESTRPAGSSTFSAPARLSPAGDDIYGPVVATGPDGTTVATWQNEVSCGPCIRFIQQVTRPAGSAAFSAPENLTDPTGYAGTPGVAVGPGGQTTIAWYGTDGTNAIIRARTRPAGSSTFAAVEDLSAPGQDADTYPQVAAGPDGQATVAWDRYDGNNYIVQAASSAATFAKLTVTRAGEGSGVVTSSPAGISCGSTCSALFAIGSDVVLSATPADGSSLSSWSGAGCSGAAATCTVKMSGAASVTATFGLGGSSAPTVKVVTTTRTIGASTISLKSSVAVNGPGTITQKAVRRGGTKQTLCTAKRATTAAGTFSLTCAMGRSVINELHRHAIRYSLVTTFTDAAGVAVTTSSKVMVLPRIGARPVPVTG